MTKREEEVLRLIRDNPLISQKDCAALLGISRSAVAGHIMNLTDKGFIKGKGYVLKEEPYAVVIGGANMDITGSPHSVYISRDSNPGTVTVSAGGVGRNIAENLARMNCSVKLLTLLGNDIYGSQLMSDCRNSGIDMNYALVLENSPTSTYLSILDDKKDMISAISSMSIMEEFSERYIDSCHRIINSAALLILDANLPERILRYISAKYRGRDIFIDTVSTAKAEKVRDFIGEFHTVKPNKIEAETLTGIKINNRKDMERASRNLIEKGVKRVFLSLGDDGVLYSDREVHLLFRNEPVKPVNTTGAGDAYTAALAYGYLHRFEVEKTLAFASAASTLTVLSKDTINRDMNIQTIERMITGRIENE